MWWIGSLGYEGREGGEGRLRAGGRLRIATNGAIVVAASAGTLTAWRLSGSPAAWVKAQSIKVPIQYGSSG